MKLRDRRNRPRAVWIAAYLLLLGSLAAGAPLPGQVDFQGLLLDSAGLRVNGMVDLDFALYPTPTGGSAVWSESHPDVEVLDGVYQVALGSTVPLGEEVLAPGSLHLEVTVEGETLTPRQPLLAVPYALRARQADSASTVTAPLAQVPALNAIADVDRSAIVRGTSLTLGPDGLPVVAYSHVTGAEEGLKVLTCGDPSCTTVAAIHDIAQGRPTRFPSIAIGSDGLPIVSYFDFGSGQVSFKKCETRDCSAVGGGPLDAAGAGCTSLAVGLDGLPLISYVGDTGDVEIAKCETIGCRPPPAPIFRTIDATQDFDCTALAVGLDGRPYVAYTAPSLASSALWIARCSDAACSSSVSRLVDMGGSPSRRTAPSLTIGRDGLPVVSYLATPPLSSNMELRVVHCNDADCSAVTESVIGDVGPASQHQLDAGSRTAIRLGPDGNPVLAYPSFAPGGGLGCAVCSSPTCENVLLASTVDASETRYLSLTVGADGRPILAYRGDGVRLLRCGNRLCLDNWTRR